MTSNNPKPTHWAIIVGINYYPSDRCLQGSVRDAQVVRHHLEDRDLPVDINILTATTPASGRTPPEQPERWPTYANVVSGLRRILDIAQPGDLVYLHYSGHGARLPSDAQSGSNTSGELALVLFEDDDVGSRYLRGPHLATALRKMVDKGLTVTLVLDCCFSGSVARHSDWHGFDVRCIDYNPKITIAEPQICEKSIFGSNSTSRDAHAERDWLVDPKGYTILSACGPYERAYEVNIEGQGRRGALTHFLFSTLRSLGTSRLDVTHQSLHEHLRTRFHASWPQQTPMRYGNMNLSFFGQLVSKPESNFFSAYKKEDGRICLRAGEVHGIYQGDEFALLPFGEFRQTTEQREKSGRILRVHIVRPFESDLVEISPQSGTTAEITTGWIARPMMSSSPRKIRFQLATGIDDRQRWKDACHEMRYLQLATEMESQPTMFNVVMNKHGEYGILDSLYNPVIGLPMVPATSVDAITKVLGILDHLSTFKYFEGVENPLSKKCFASLFSLTTHSASDSRGTFAVSHGNIWGVTIENTSEKPLYMVIYNFSPLWEVTNLASGAGDDSYLVIPPRDGEVNGVREIRLRMEVPDELLQTGSRVQCEDIVKVFVTSKPISFPTFVLPKMSLDFEHAGRQNRGLDDLFFLQALQTHLRGDNDAIEEQWATRNFIIQSTCN
ncbi:caspase domain-containing protein [Xylaria sp. FL0064]|nr:caspase domain-containing protein [Xylaria sp. FL0064]